jgi:alpha-galactosidase
MTAAIGMALAARIRIRRRSNAWQHPAVIERHAISVTREHAGDVFSVATCQCGRFRSRVEISEIADQDVAIEAHRRDVIAAAIGVAA